MLWPLWAYDAVVAQRTRRPDRAVDAKRERDPGLVEERVRRVVVRVERSGRGKLRALAHVRARRLLVQPVEIG